MTHPLVSQTAFYGSLFILFQYSIQFRIHIFHRLVQRSVFPGTIGNKRIVDCFFQTIRVKVSDKLSLIENSYKNVRVRNFFFLYSSL